MPGRLADKVAIVTAAGSGIGRATVVAFAREGARIVANDLDPEALAATAELAQGEVIAQPGDITTKEANQALVACALQHFGRLDIFDCVAGGAQPVPMLELSDDDYRAQLALNQDSVWFGTRAALVPMLEQGKGSIVATSSGAGISAVHGLSVYGMAKAGLTSLMRSIALEFGAQGIRANTIAPGPMLTAGLQAFLDTQPGGAAAFGAQTPSGRLGTPEEIAEAAVFLASDEASYVSGALLPVDGAIHAKLSGPTPTDQ